jgi:tartrate dehydratase alpha subunit/fumarate hydratase class I-like protein
MSTAIAVTTVKNQVLIHPVDEADFAALAAQCSERGLDIQGLSGQTTLHGVTIAWAHEAAAKQLVLTVVNKPWFHPMGMVVNKIANLLQAEFKK